ncbi:MULTISPECIES: response regulator [Bacillaceae]|uniref:response regulator n=1 Tax=Bacillaceae TaxID=186817 RepID=UPI002964BC3C|nr:response regulator [Bacillus infantis]MDW2878092.1 response regulator [Bacillus infantis]
MYKVIVVEDDRIIRRGICESIKWGAHGFVVAGEAGDGETALGLIEKEQPQVVISDINMPFMDGLEMGKKVREISPETRIIFLTGYEEFKYAQQALKMKAFDYLLKPVDSEHLLLKAKEAAADWELEARREMKVTESLPYLQQKFFRELMREGHQQVDVEKELNELGVGLEGPTFAAVLVHSTAGLHENTMKRLKEAASSLFTAGQIIVMHIDSNECAVLLSLDDENDLRKGKLANLMLHTLYEHDGQSATITLGRTYQNLFELGKSLLESRLAMDLRHIMGNGKVFSFEDTVSGEKEANDSLQMLESELECQIKLGIPEKVSEILGRLNKAILERRALPLSDLKVLALKFSTLLFFESEKWKKEESISFNSSDVYERIMEMETLTEMMEILQSLVSQWADALHRKQDKNHFSHVDQAIIYMKEHFHDSTLSLKKVAEIIHVSTPYLSNLFKLEKGFNFGDYLLELRMNKAMEELRLGDLKTYEICEKVGYSNPQYFSVCFKKYTGYTPAEYKKQFE